MRPEIIFSLECDCYGHSPIFKKKRVLLQRGNIRIVAFTSSDGQSICIYPQHRYLLIWWTATMGKSISTPDATQERIMSIAHEIMERLLEREEYAKKAEELIKHDMQVPRNHDPRGNYS